MLVVQAVEGAHGRRGGVQAEACGADGWPWRVIARVRSCRWKAISVAMVELVGAPASPWSVESSWGSVAEHGGACSGGVEGRGSREGGGRRHRASVPVPTRMGGEADAGGGATLALLEVASWTRSSRRRWTRLRRAELAVAAGGVGIVVLASVTEEKASTR